MCRINGEVALQGTRLLGSGESFDPELRRA
jgi:hypothetical protein